MKSSMTQRCICSFKFTREISLGEDTERKLIAAATETIGQLDWFDTVHHRGKEDESTMIIVTAKHGQSPIDPKALLRIPADNTSLMSPNDVLGSLTAGSIEDDVSMLWLADQSQTVNAVSMLSANPSVFGGGEIYAGKSLSLIFNDPTIDSRSPDILVTPTVGEVYTGGTKKVAEHGGFSHDDRNVMLLLANPRFTPTIITSPAQTAQVAPPILKARDLNPHRLKASNRST